MRVGTNKMVGRLAETLVNQSLYTEQNELLPSPLRYLLPGFNPRSPKGKGLVATPAVIFEQRFLPTNLYYQIFIEIWGYHIGKGESSKLMVQTPLF